MRLHLRLACAISFAALGCTSSPVDQSSATQAEATRQASENDTLSRALRDVSIARWEGFRSLATLLPGRAIVAVELFRTRQDQTLAVFTTVANGEPVRSAVIGDAHGVLLPAELQAEAIKMILARTATLSDGSSVDPDGVAVGRPAPEEPPTPGILAAASDILATAFGGESLATGRRTHPPITLTAPMAVEQVEAGTPVDRATLVAELQVVMDARWEGFRLLAQQLPNRELLSVELIRTRQDQTVAVFVVVENGAPVKYAVVGDALGRVPPRGLQAGANRGSAALVEMPLEGGSVDPANVAYGNPPPTEPITPGIIAAGQELLAVIFQRIVAPLPEVDL